MATAAQESLYPFSTRKEESIPLDIIDPMSLIRVDVPASGNVSCTIPAGFEEAFVYCVEGCFIQFAAASLPTPPVSGTVYADTLCVPPGCILTVRLTPGVARIIPFGSKVTTLVLQQIRKWNSLALQQQVTRR